MSLEEALAENTAALKAMTAALASKNHVHETGQQKPQLKLVPPASPVSAEPPAAAEQKTATEYAEVRKAFLAAVTAAGPAGNEFGQSILSHFNLSKSLTELSPARYDEALELIKSKA